jgi:hypothetical protein
VTSAKNPEPSVYRQVLKEDFGRLARELQAFHGVSGRARFSGECRIEAASGAVARILRWLLRLPGAAEQAGFDFELASGTGREIWIRHFPGRVMRSTLQAAEGQVVEQVGPVGCWFSLESGGGVLAMKLTRVTVFGLAWPRAWTPEVWGNERGSGGRLYFDAGVRFPGVGLLTAYRGYLHVTPAQP